MRVIIAGGGTGGHLFPGIAVAEEFKGRDEGNELLFVGTEKGIEARVLPKLGWPLSFISAEGIKGKGVISKIRAVYKLIPGFFESIKIIKGFRPDAVIGVGGYASAPMLLAARFLGKRSAIHEQNALPGVTNRILGKVVERVFISFSDSAGFFPQGKVVVSGNPLRKEILEGLKEPSPQPSTHPGINPRGRGRKAILIFGGSLGAHRINSVVLEMIRHLDEPNRWRITHQTGEKDYKETEEGYLGADWQADVRPFIYDMAAAYIEADLVICRAGATTVAELTAAAKPAILIPYPFAADDHQRVNAESLVNVGGAVMILEKDLTGERLAREVERLLDDSEMLKKMGENARKLARVDAAKVVVDGVYELVKGRGGVTPPAEE
ncbi:MAG TPA: undecaprenyldiphospho-muramoylpentapeptide beta-N-acetylglucosaminyltransferase [Thermodesulfobacteriota bacterium]|nr:undecaprenyldiphospho-muramoylpentapeptide beta-N-acetylglucosaminyltransferase [Thermodesulfobacteriota bacterium]